MFQPSIPASLPSPKRRTRDSTPDIVSLNSALPTPVLAAKSDGKNAAEITQRDTPDVPIFSKTKKIAEIAAKRRSFMDKSLNSSRSSIRAETDSHLSEHGMGSSSDSSLVQNGQKTLSDKTSFKSSLSLNDLSMFERKGGDASSEDSFVEGRRKIPNKSKLVNGIKKHGGTRKNSSKTRLRSASLSDSRSVRGMFLGNVNYN